MTAEGESVGVPIPEDHVGAFVAEAFEDPERSTTWEDAVDKVVSPEAREEWESLSSRQQVTEVLGMADNFDRRAVETLERIPTDLERPTDRIDRLFEEARRCRRNADILRDAVAAAYRDGHADDGDLVDAVESEDFDTATIADREDTLESVATAYGYDFRPYGGTLFEEDRDGDGSHEVF